MNCSNPKKYCQEVIGPNDSDAKRIELFLKKVDGRFSIKLSLRVNLYAYSNKLAQNAFNFFLIDRYSDIAHAAVYYDAVQSKMFISSIAVVEEYSGQGLGEFLLCQIEDFACDKKVSCIELEVDCSSIKLKNFYSKNGFQLRKSGNKCIYFKKLNIVCQYKNYISRYLESINNGVAMKVANYRAFVDRAEKEPEDLLKAYPLLPVVIESLQVDTVLTISKLLEGEYADRAFQKFIDFCDCNQRVIRKSFPEMTSMLLEANKKSLNSIEEQITRILDQRDKYFAKADKKYFIDPQVLLTDYPNTYNDLVEIVQTLQLIVAEHYQIVHGSDPVCISEFAYIHSDKILGFIKEGAQAWHEKYRPGEEW